MQNLCECDFFPKKMLELALPRYLYSPDHSLAATKVNPPFLTSVCKYVFSGNLFPQTKQNFETFSTLLLIPIYPWSPIVTNELWFLANHGFPAFRNPMLKYRKISKMRETTFLFFTVNSISKLVNINSLVIFLILWFCSFNKKLSNQFYDITSLFKSCFLYSNLKLRINIDHLNSTNWIPFGLCIWMKLFKLVFYLSCKVNP